MNQDSDSSSDQIILPYKKRVRTPTVIQMEAVECGAAALAIVMGYYKKIVPLEQLRIDCGVSRDGSNAVNVLKAAEKYGFEAGGFKQELENIEEFDVPYIVFWQFNHFIVVEGFKKDKVYINDPASGPRTISLDEFDRGFTGVILEIRPGPDFEPGGAEPSIFEALKRRFAGHYVPVLYLFLAGLVLVVPGLLTPIFTKVFVDNYLVARLQSWVKPILIGMGITAVVTYFMTYVQQYYLIRLETKLSISTSTKFFWHVLRLPLDFFAQRSVGDITNRISLNDNVAEFISGKFASTILSAVMVVFYAMLMFYYDVTLTLIGIVIAAGNIFLLRFIARVRQDMSQQLIAEDSKEMGAAINGIMAIESLKSAGRASDFFAKWSGYQANVLNTTQALQKSGFWLSSFPAVLNALNTALILTIGGIRVIDGYMTVGMLVAFQSLMASFIGPVNDLVGIAGEIQELKGDMGKLDDVMHQKIEPTLSVISNEDEESSDEQTYQKLKGHVELRKVTFGYSRLEAPLLVDFDLTLKPGARVALVGHSGSGKSTVAKLLMGLYQPWSGEIFFDGELRNNIPHHILVNSVSMVDQDIFIFKSTVRENITMLNYTIPEYDVIRAAQDACIHTDIAARRGGYDAIIDEAGRDFSGGQRQRLEIARALVTNPRILILDEATNSLDPITEATIDDNVRKRGCTTIIVAHRLSTIRDCDEIIVLDHGKVVQRGNHDELKDQEGEYKTLISVE